MKRISATIFAAPVFLGLLALGLLALTVAGGCDDSNDTPTDGGSKSDALDAAGDGAALACTGSFSQLTRSSLGTMTVTTGKCAAAKDLDFVCAGNVTAKLHLCGTVCKDQSNDSQVQLACISPCLQSGTELSMGCADCFRDFVACTTIECAAVCAADLNADACKACQVSKGCAGALFRCSGLPTGSTSTADAAPDAVVDTAPKVDAVVDAKVDAKVDATADAKVDATADAQADATSDGGADGGTDAAADAADAADATD